MQNSKEKTLSQRIAGVSHISGIEIVGVANIKEAIEAVK